MNSQSGSDGGPYVEQLLTAGDPSTRYKLALAGLGNEDPSTLRVAIHQSERVIALLSERGLDGRIARHPYSKWTGAHWILAVLADIGYPSGDASLVPLREQVLDWLLDGRRLSPKRVSDEPYLAPILKITGRTRIHASLEGNALYALLALGIADHRADQLAQRLVDLQWEDGGWNCDRTPGASHSSFEETLIPLRGLIWHARERGSKTSARAARRAAEFFLSHQLFRRKSNGNVISSKFLELHYPCYWHYDVLFALKVLGEGGFTHDPRCNEAIARLRSKQRLDGGWPAERKFWVGRTSKGQRSLVSWGPTGRSRSNEFVTADALRTLSFLK